MIANSAHAVSPSTTQLILAEERFLRQLAHRLARRHADAADLVQETMLRAYAARERFIPGTSIRAWLGTILRRLYVTEALRRSRRATSTDTDTAGAVGRAAFSIESQDPDDFGYVRALERVDETLKRALDRLPPVYRTAFLHFALDGLSYAEIGQRVQIPIGTVISRIHRARNRIRSSLICAPPARSVRRRRRVRVR